MFTSCIVKKDGGLVTGFTPDLRNRLIAHQKGFVFSTKSRLPVTLIHYEAFLIEADAKRREEYLKGGNGKKDIEKILQDYFRENPWKKSNKIIDRPQNAKVCPICSGFKKASTKSFFGRNGDSKSGYKAICLTCKGKGWIIPAPPEEY